MNFKKHYGFTLIEILIVMSITFLVIGGSYIPYRNAMNKQKLNEAQKVVSMVLNEARYMAINGYKDGKNKSIGVLVDSNKALLYTLPYRSESINDDKKFLREYSMPYGINISSLGDNYKNMFFLFEALSGDLKIYSYINNQMQDISLGNRNFIEIDFTYGSKNDNDIFKKTITYFTDTYIIDYE